MTEARPAPLGGERVTIFGEEFVVTRVTVQSKNKTHVVGAADTTQHRDLDNPTRAQIDLIPVAEAEKRLASLQALLAGTWGEE